VAGVEAEGAVWERWSMEKGKAVPFKERSREEVRAPSSVAMGGWTAKLNPYNA